jgi:hypothetical protein
MAVTYSKALLLQMLQENDVNVIADVIDAGLTSGSLTVPQPHQNAVGAPAAVTSVQEATANGSDAATTQALANSLKIKYNAAQVDVAALQTELAALTTSYNLLLTQLQAAHIES